ncbi:MAG: hypothetical protein AAF645_25785, partial [Myxococcota bacterium]
MRYAIFALALGLFACGDDDAAMDAAPDEGLDGFVAELGARTDAAGGMDARPDLRPPEPVNCAPLAASFSLCESTESTCAAVFEDSSGCTALCESAGLTCVSSFENVDGTCAADRTLPELECEDTGHISDYCVCGRGSTPDAGVPDAGVPDAAMADGAVPGEVLAFPSARGAGAYATGGRGGRVIRVTNLNDAGEGSLRAALNAEGPRIITFAVSGIILVDSTIRVSNGDFTLAGHTAPSGGITLSGPGRVLEFRGANNFVVRFLRVRPEYTSFDALGLIDCSNFIFDHASVSWGGDEVMTTRGDTDDVTFQRLLLAEGKTGSLFGDSDNPELSENLSFHHNAFYNVTHRHPNVHTYGRSDVYNNVVFNWRFRWSVVIGDVQLNHMNNYYAQGCVDDPNGNNSFNKVFYNAAFEPEIHSAGNLVMPTHLTDPDEDNWRLWNWRIDVDSGPYAGARANTQLTADYQVAEPFALLGPATRVQSAEEAYGDVSNDVGANRRIDERGNVIDEQDDIDAFYLRGIRAGDCVAYRSSSSGHDFDTTSHYRTFIDGRSSEPVARGYADANEDGIPDAWATARGFSPTDDLSVRRWPSGYIGVEEY